MAVERPDEQRIVITGVGLTAPNGNSLPEFRQALLGGPQRRDGLRNPLFRPHPGGGLQLRRASLSEAEGGPPRHPRRRHRHLLLPRGDADSGLDWENVDRSTVGIYVGVTEHGNVETENEIYLLKGYDYDTQYWSHHHNPRTVANNPAGEISLNLGITGPHYTLGAACAAGNAGHHPGRADAAAGRLRRGPLRRRVGEHSHLRHLRQLPQPRGAGPARRPRQGVPPLRRRPQRHRGGRRGLHVRAGAAQPTPAAAGRRSTARWPATR